MAAVPSHALSLSDRDGAVRMVELFFKQKRYFSLLFLLFKDSVFRLKKNVLLVLLLGKISVITQAATFVSSIYVLRKLSLGENRINLFDYYSLELSAQSPAHQIFLAAAFIIFLLVISEVGIYVSRRKALQLNRVYNEICSKRVLELISSDAILHRSVKAHTEFDKKMVLRSGMKDARVCGIVLRKLLDSFVPFLTLGFAFGVLLYLNSILTLIIIVFLSVYVSLQAIISRKAAKYAMMCENIGPRARRKYAELIDHFLKEPLFNSTDQNILKKSFDTGALRNSLDAYIGRIMTIPETRFVTGVFSALIFAIVIAILILKDDGKEINWGVMLAYLVALRFALVNLKGLFVQVTSINRLYPSVYRYFEFINSFNVNPNNSKPISNEFTFQVQRSPLTNKCEDVKLRPGSLTALVSPFAQLNRATTGKIIACLLSSTNISFETGIPQFQFVGTENHLPSNTLRGIFKLLPDEGWEDIRLPGKMIARIKRGLSKDLDKQLRPAQWRRIDSDIAFLLSLRFSINSVCNLLLIEERGYRLINEHHDDIRPMLSKHICLINHGKNFRRVGRYNEAMVAAISRDSCLGAGSFDWFASEREQLKAVLLMDSNASLGKASVDEVEIDDEEFE